ncbi:Retrovirus-related Pol polyprotein from transposon 17.6, partial [Dictyocoela muelleri]
KSEINYSIVEKEFMAIVSALNHYRNIIQGFHVEVITDSKNCTYESKLQIGRIQRWKFLLVEFDINISTIKGQNNNIADSLSRCFIIDNKTFNSSFIMRLKSFLEKDNDNKFNKDSKERYIVKTDVYDEFLSFIHSFCIHPGISVMYENLKQLFYIPKIKLKIKNLILNCKICTQFKRKNFKKLKN